MSTPLPRSEFAVTQRYVYLNHAAVAALPRGVVERVSAFVHAQGERGVLASYNERDIASIRERIGAYIGATGAEIALVRNTGDGANVVATGIDWRPGDRVILADDEFPSNAIPWLALRDRGVDVHLVRERLTPDALRRAVTPTTRVVAVSWVNFADGYRHDLQKLAEIAHGAGALFCVDAIQGLGAFRIDVARMPVDVLYTGAQKWLLALQGSGFVYVRASVLDRLRVGSPGWRSLENMWDFLNYDQPYAADSSRFEGGTPNFVGALSIDSALQLLDSAAGDAIERHVLALTDSLVEGLRSQGARVHSHRGDGISSGIVTFDIPGLDSIALGRAVQHEGAITTYREGGIRVSPHGYTSHDDITRFLEILNLCSQHLRSSQH